MGTFQTITNHLVWKGLHVCASIVKLDSEVEVNITQPFNAAGVSSCDPSVFTEEA